MSGTLDTRETLEQVVELLLVGERDAAAALLDGAPCGASVLVLAAAPPLFAEYVAARDHARGELVIRLATAARDWAKEHA